MRRYSEELDEHICAQLRKLFALELGAQSLAELHDDGLLTREHFAPMKRLLAKRGEAYLRAQGYPREARQIRRDHRQAYWLYVEELTAQVRRQRLLRKLAMNGAGNWDVRADMQKTVICQSALFNLRWLGWKRFFGIRVDVSAIEDCLAVLIPEFRPISEAT